MMKTCCCCQKHLISNPQKEGRPDGADENDPRYHGESSTVRCEVAVDPLTMPTRSPRRVCRRVPKRSTPCGGPSSIARRPTFLQRCKPATPRSEDQARSKSGRQKTLLLDDACSLEQKTCTAAPPDRDLPRVLEEGAARRDTRPVLVPNPNAAGTCNAAGQARRPATA